MKHGWAIRGALLLLVAGVAILVYIVAQGWVTSLPWYLLVFLLVVGILALVGAIAWLAGWLPREKLAEPEPQRAVIETPEAESSYVAAEEETTAEPEPVVTEETKAEAEHVAEDEVTAEPSHVMEETAEEPSHLTEAEIARARRLVEGPRDRGSSIISLEGIGSVYAEKLNAVNIYTTSDLLKAGATPDGRAELAEKLGISDKLVLEWVNMADLLRIRGVGEEYSDLLEEAGVDTVVELAKRVPENLHARLREENTKKQLVRRVPTLAEVKRWIEEAKTLPRRVEY